MAGYRYQAVKAIDTLTSIAGLYGLTADGQLGAYTGEKALVVDVSLSRALAPQIRQLLRSYLADPNGGTYRVGLAYHAAQPRPWSSDTLVLEESVVREVYPVSGPSMQELTAFQRKNREQSIYRGIELLIEYRYERLVDSPVYCPLLYDRELTLDQYPPSLSFGASPGVPTAVLEVLNLMAMIPLGRRNTPELAALMKNMHRYLVRKEARRGGLFTLAQERYIAGANASGDEAEFFDVDKRHERQQTLTGAMLEQRLAAVDHVQRADRFDQVERWLERPHRPVDPSLLRTFVQFRDLDGDRLAALVQKALVHVAPGGAKLLNIGMQDAWNMYLLEGTLALQAADGGSLFVTGGTDKAASPISFLKPRKYNVTAVTPVSFLWIHDVLLEAVLIPPDPAPRPVSALKPKGF